MTLEERLADIKIKIIVLKTKITALAEQERRFGTDSQNKNLLSIRAERGRNILQLGELEKLEKILIKRVQQSRQLRLEIESMRGDYQRMISTSHSPGTGFGRSNPNVLRARSNRLSRLKKDIEKKEKQLKN